ncbi:hypothetical protein [Halobacillus halophilus]|uniref:hypothetical protein n=1 Tax=Halobacillus halophilus TaxID=1570 RepID=UPI001CD35984|nr:hypothetical protein [Halobacillus halophilus]MCA1009569.1 hypothetical protein [Halobacillus halophilus]
MKVRIILAILMVIVLSGCGREEVTFESVEKLPGLLAQQKLMVGGKGVFEEDDKHYAFIVVHNGETVEFDQVYYLPDKDHALNFKYKIKGEPKDDKKNKMNVEVIEYHPDQEIKSYWFNENRI